MTTPPRYLYKFESLDGTSSVTFPLHAYEYEQNQATVNPSAPVTGAGYEYRLLGRSQAPKGTGVERVRFIDVQTDAASLDTDIAGLKSEIFEIGFGKLWTVGADATLRWAYGVVQDMPQLTLVVGAVRHMPVLCAFTRYTDWFAEALAENTPTMITGVPFSFTVTNAGNATVYDVIIYIKGTFSDNTIVTNVTTGDQFTCTQAGADVSDWLRVDAGHYAVDFSSDSGVTYTSAYSSFSLPDGQVHFMRLAPGVNEFTIDFVASFTPSGPGAGAAFAWMSGSPDDEPLGTVNLVKSLTPAVAAAQSSVPTVNPADQLGAYSWQALEDGDEEEGVPLGLVSVFSRAVTATGTTIEFVRYAAYH